LRPCGRRAGRGTPVAVFEKGDGSILITEDHNGTLLRLARRPP
jgi:glucose/arabinose dehydrogenase